MWQCPAKHLDQTLREELYCNDDSPHNLSKVNHFQSFTFSATQSSLPKADRLGVLQSSVSSPLNRHMVTSCSVVAQPNVWAPFHVIAVKCPAAPASEQSVFWQRRLSAAQYMARSGTQAHDDGGYPTTAMFSPAGPKGAVFYKSNLEKTALLGHRKNAPHPKCVRLYHTHLPVGIGTHHLQCLGSRSMAEP